MDEYSQLYRLTVKRPVTSLTSNFISHKKGSESIQVRTAQRQKIYGLYGWSLLNKSKSMCLICIVLKRTVVLIAISKTYSTVPHGQKIAAFY